RERRQRGKTHADRDHGRRASRPAENSSVHFRLPVLYPAAIIHPNKGVNLSSRRRPMKLATPIAMLGVSMAVGISQSVTDPLAQYRTELQTHHNSSLVHFRIGEILGHQGNYQDAANELREALSGDLQPRWIEVWAHIYLGRIYEATG